MKNLAIKTKIILWYTTLVALLMLLVLIFLFSTASKTAAFYAKNNLIAAVQEMSQEIEIDEGQVDVDHDFKPYEKGALLLGLYKDTIVAGQYPPNFPLETALNIGSVFPVTAGYYRWLVYDVAIEKDLFLRGIYPMNEGGDSWNQTLLIALVAFPLFLLLAVLGGYFITRRAFFPVAKIARTAGEIESGNDLSKRLSSPDAGDEISALSQSFDAMLDRLEAAFADEKQFTSDVSHELRTPLSVLKIQCEYAFEQAENPEVHTELGEMISKIDRMTALVAQLLELSRAERHSSQIRFESVDISELLDLVAEELAPSAAEKSITLTVESGRNITLNCEQTLLMRLMLNLIENAIKYTNSGGHIMIRLRTESNTLRFSVKDDGIGIASVDQNKIFNRFYQVNPARTGAGFGLGLSFCRWIATVHHGDIIVESTVGEGSLFTVLLPL